MFKKIFVISAAISFLGVAVEASTLSGEFNVVAVNVTNLDSDESQATLENLTAALAGTLGGENSETSSTAFSYSGDFDFNVGGPQRQTPYSIETWLGTGTGNVTDLDETFGNLQLSFPDISAGTATTTFFAFVSASPVGAADFTIRHDDGVTLYDGFDLVGGNVGPTGVITTEVTGFDGGGLSIIYAATNGNPSVLEIDMTPVPLPAGGLLLISSIAGLAAIRRRRKTA